MTLSATSSFEQADVITSRAVLRRLRRQYPTKPLMPPGAGSALSYTNLVEGTLGYIRVMSMIGRHHQAGGAVIMTQVKRGPPAEFDIEFQP